MIKQRLGLLILGGVAALGAATLNHAGIRELIEKVANDETTFELSVVDGRGTPIDGATVWFFGDDATRTDLRVEDMRRLAARHGEDVDFIFENSIHPELLIERTHANGLATVRLEDSDLGSLQSVRTHFAVLKSGWLPVVLTRTARRGASESIAVRLERNPAARLDARLERLDQLRASAHAVINSPDDLLTKENERKLQHVSTELRKLAGELEKDGAADAAAAVYFNLAYLPTMTLEENRSDRTMTREYTTGFHADSPQKVADRAAAWRLVKSHPTVSYQAVLEKYTSEGLLGGPTSSRDAVRKAYLADSEKFFDLYAAQAWASFHVPLWQMYGALGQADRACEALKTFHEFEPSYYTANQWRKQLENYEADVRLFRSSPSRKCELPGLS